MSNIKLEKNDKLIVRKKEEGVKYDQNKHRLELLPAEAIEAISEVLSFGAHKYGTHNWAKGMAWSRLLGAALRHIYSWSKGEDLDTESGLSHLAHAACCLVFLLYYERYNRELDDRLQRPTINK